MNRWSNRPMDGGMDGPMDELSDKASYKVAGPRLKREMDGRDCDKMLFLKIIHNFFWGYKFVSIFSLIYS